VNCGSRQQEMKKLMSWNRLRGLRVSHSRH